MPRRKRRSWKKAIVSCAVLLGGAATIVVVLLRSRSEPVSSAQSTEPVAAATFVGEAACAPCHAREAAAWRGSQHQRAMQRATDSTVLGDFANATLTHGDVTSTFFRHNGKPMVRTDGPDGIMRDYEVSYTFGVAPLQQYLVGFPDGKFQALTTAWDSRPKDAGGQRWFHLNPGERIGHTDELHWTGATENWNYMCADCHSTNVRKSWSAKTATYTTQFADVSVACEACHGPGSRHVAWANEPADRRRAFANKGLSIGLDEREGVVWARDPVTNKPTRSRPRATEREIEMCARCHSRRGLVHEDVVHGQPVTDDYQVALLDDDLYYPDGQIKGEVYEYGSFIQSRMFAHGVTCSDCHDPHSQQLRAPGDSVCATCHAPETYATGQHHFHPDGSAGASCVSCHMPATTYMVLDDRRDHSLRIPRPDLSVKLGVPNACNGCHKDQTTSWAATTVDAWYRHTPSGFQQFAEALAAGTQGTPTAPAQLLALIADHGQPAIARASAIARLEPMLVPAMLEPIREALGDPSPLVRSAAVHALAVADPQWRAGVLSPLLDDPVRTVRVATAEALADVPPTMLPATKRASLQRAAAEFVAVQELNGDRPEAHVALALVYAKQQSFDRAEAELQRALAIDPDFVPASVNLADLYRAQRRDRDAEPVLRKALTRRPNHPTLLHALGLVLVRENRTREAIEALGAAARLGTNNPRNGYVYAVALHSAGQKQEARRELESVLRQHPYDRDSLAALVAFLREAGDERGAQTFADRLGALDAPK